MSTTRQRPEGPLTVGTDIFAELTIEENSILRHHLTSGWYKVPAVHGSLTDLWWEVSHLLDDMHAAHEVLLPPYEDEVPEPAAVPDGVAEADPDNPYGSYTDPAGKHGRYDAASPAEVAEGVGSGQCSRRNPHTPHGSCQGSAPEFPSEHVEVMPACECTDPDCPDAVHQEPAELRTDDAWEDAR